MAALTMKRLPNVVSAVLAVAIVAVLADIFWSAFGPNAEATLPLEQVTEPLPRQDSERVLEGLSIPLFGVETQEPAMSTVTAVAAPETSLDLTLRGVAAATNKEDSWAIVEGPDRRNLPYRVGDKLPGEAKLVAIDADRIILNHRGNLEALYFSDEPGMRDARPAFQAMVEAEKPIQLSEASRERVRTYLTMLVNEPERWTELVRALPVNEDGRFRGYRLFPGQQPALFREMGLHRGDIAMGINGITLDEAIDGPSLVAQLTSADRFELEILRKGEMRTLDIRL